MQILLLFSLGLSVLLIAIAMVVVPFSFVFMVNLVAKYLGCTQALPYDFVTWLIGFYFTKCFGDSNAFSGVTENIKKSFKK